MPFDPPLMAFEPQTMTGFLSEKAYAVPYLLTPLRTPPVLEMKWALDGVQSDGV